MKPKGVFPKGQILMYCTVYVILTQMLVKSWFKLPDQSLSSVIILVRKMIGSLKFNSRPWKLSCWNAQDFVSGVLGLHSPSAFSLRSRFPQLTFEKAKLNYSADTEPTSIYSHLLEILASVTNANMCLDRQFLCIKVPLLPPRKHRWYLC